LKENLTTKPNPKKNPKIKKKTKRKMSPRKKTKDKEVKAQVQILPVQELHQIHLLLIQTIQEIKGTETEKTEILEEAARKTDDQSPKAREREPTPGRNHERIPKRIQERSPERNRTRKRNQDTIHDTILAVSHGTSVMIQETRTDTEKGEEVSTEEVAAGTIRVTADDDFINLTNDSLTS
jgi:hypothetical protein